MERICPKTFRESGLKSIVIPSWVVCLCKESFYQCKSLVFVTFEAGSRLERIDERVFYETGLTSNVKPILIPRSAVLLGRESFSHCGSLDSVAFESGSRLERIDEKAFSESGLKSIVIPSSVVVLGNWSFWQCKSLESVTFEPGSRLELIDGRAFYGTGLKSIVIPLSVVVLGVASFAYC
jgi:hypothetical protein